MQSVKNAHDLILASAPAPKQEIVSLQNAIDRVLLEPVFADRDYPPINRATMDGIAISMNSWNAGIRSWRIEYTLPAGNESINLIDSINGCAQIMTGASVPDNADGVIPFELLDITNEMAHAKSEALFVPGQNIHLRGIDRKTGDRLLMPGVRIDAPRIAIMGSVGHADVCVSVPPRVDIISTGNEVVPVAQAEISPVQVRASNALGIVAALNRLGIISVNSRHVPDNREIIEKEIGQSLRNADILILSGGVSMGKYDYVPDALNRSGVETIFHKVAQKPGKPLWFGKTERCHVFGLPGNPVSTLTVFRRYVTPFVMKCLGLPAAPPLKARNISLMRPHRSLTTFPPVCGRISEAGILEIQTLPYHGSGDFASLCESSGFVEIPPGDKPIPENSILPFFDWAATGSMIDTRNDSR
ncbi:MAG TPA: molybdopterin molybdotransferase MoeA [Kiritimatiellia bacterium]|nr:molybdopterin molybdotransferase MoeA [Kiritimatiellia bacterium]